MKNEERNIGDVFEYEGIPVEIVSNDGYNSPCNNCCFNGSFHEGNKELSTGCALENMECIEKKCHYRVVKKPKIEITSELIREGDKVVFVDGSYTLTILAESNDLKNTILGLSKDIWTVVAVNVPCPTEKDILHYDVLNDHLIPENNCIVKNEKGDIAFCSRINIRRFTLR